MEEAPENGKESLHSAHANGMNEWMNAWMNEYMNEWMCSNQAKNDECQHFGNMTAPKSRNYNGMVWCVYGHILKSK
jgi:hypothetical protein